MNYIERVIKDKSNINKNMILVQYLMEINSKEKSKTWLKLEIFKKQY
jgi:hypothetical protein